MEPAVARSKIYYFFLFWGLKRLQKDLTLVLHRSVEAATLSGHAAWRAVRPLVAREELERL